MNKVTIGFSRPKKWKPFAWLIMIAYGIDYDHVYVKIRSDKYGRDLIYQASSVMVNFMGTDVWGANNDVVAEFEIEMSDENYVKMMQFAIDNAGKPYGIKQIVGLAWVRVCQLAGRKVSNPFADDGATFVCSEIGACVLQDFDGVNLGESVDDATPPFVFDLMTALVADHKSVRTK